MSTSPLSSQLVVEANLLGWEASPPKAGRDAVEKPCHNRTASYIPDALAKSDTFSQPTQLLSLAQDLQNHFEMRIQLFCQQLFLVYKTNFLFSGGPTKDVVGRGDVKLQTQAAHSGTLPSLLYNTTAGETALVFAKKSQFYTSWNATVLLPILANQVDSKIDGTTRGKYTFRARCIEILNDASQGKKTPQEGLHAFLTRVVSVLEGLEKTEYRALTCKRIVVQNYLQVARSYQTLAMQGPRLHR